MRSCSVQFGCKYFFTEFLHQSQLNDKKRHARQNVRQTLKVGIFGEVEFRDPDLAAGLSISMTSR